MSSSQIHSSSWQKGVCRIGAKNVTYGSATCVAETARKQSMPHQGGITDTSRSLFVSTVAARLALRKTVGLARHVATLDAWLHRASVRQRGTCCITRQCQRWRVRRNFVAATVHKQNAWNVPSASSRKTAPTSPSRWCTIRKIESPFALSAAVHLAVFQRARLARLVVILDALPKYLDVQQ